MEVSQVTYRLKTVLDAGTLTDQARQDALEEHFDRLMEALLAQEEADPLVTDPDLSADLITGDVEVRCFIQLPQEMAVGHASVFIRAAIHAAGDHTPGWGEHTPRHDAIAYRKASDELTIG